MSKQAKRPRGKRPRDDEVPRHDFGVGFSPINPHASFVEAGTASSSSKTQSQRGDGRTALATEAAKSRPLLVATQPPPGKVAIPALKSSRSLDSPKFFKKGRTPHACDYCRKAKAGCTGGQPCTRCKSAGVACVYGDGKRDKDRKKLTKLSRDASILSQHNSEICDALRRIRIDNTLSQEDLRLAIDDVLAMTPAGLSADDTEGPPLVSETASPRAQESSGEEELSEVGSTGALDVVGLDTDTDNTRATGHIGKSSSVAWAKRTAEECEDNSQQDSAARGHEASMILVSYHTEEADVEFFDATIVQPFDWPDRNDADELVALFFTHVYPAQPLLDEATFMNQYHRFPRGSINMSPDNLIWLGTLNLIFGIGAVYRHLTKAQHRGIPSDHLVYLTRAKMLCLDQGLLYEDARVTTVSALGILALYFMATCRLNRAWTFCGVAIRQALTLGLHLRSEAQALPENEKEYRVRLWWCLYCLECSLNELTGRPSCVCDRDISTPLPLNSAIESLPSLHERIEDIQVAGLSSRRSSRGARGRFAATFQMPIGAFDPQNYSFAPLTLPITSATYFIYRIQLCIISHEIMTQLYCAATIKSKWSEVQATIRRIDKTLLEWKKCLPPEFGIDFDVWDEPNLDDPIVLSRIGLAMQFCSSRIILFRPCLCRFEGRSKDQSDRSKDFNQFAVEECVHSAREMIGLINTTTRNFHRLYTVTPWWNTLHYICEALSVLMLEMAFRSQHLPSETTLILDDAKKGVRWLRTMAEQSVSARKAWEIFDRLIRLVAPMINWSVMDLPTDAPVPPSYNIHRFSNLSSTTPAPHPHTYQQHHPSSAPWQQHDPHHGFDPAYPTGFGAPASSSMDVAANPLDHMAALQRFESIGQLHGHYDDPWQHIFDISGHNIQPGVDMEMQGAGGGLGGGGGQMEGPQMQPPYGTSFDQYDPMPGLHEGFQTQAFGPSGSGQGQASGSVGVGGVYRGHGQGQGQREGGTEYDSGRGRRFGR